MKDRPKAAEEKSRPRLRKETLRGLGFAELDQVHGGNRAPPVGHVNRPGESRYCID